MALTPVVEIFGGIYHRYYGTAAPSDANEGPFMVGDEVINTAPAAGGSSYRGWVCTTAGTGATATFKGFGLLET